MLILVFCFLALDTFSTTLFCIASILISMLGIFNPSISLGCDASFQFMVVFLSFHRKVFICFSIFSWMSLAFH